MKNLKKLLFILVVILLLSLFSYSLYKIYDSNKKTPNTLPQQPINKAIDKEKELTEKEEALKLFSKNINLEEERKKHNNEEIIARLEIPNLFNILVAKAEDNDYYLDHSIDRKKSKLGSEYLDYRTIPTSKQVNIYGHNSSTYNVPFRKLEKLLKKDFFDETPYILLQYDEGTRVYKIFSIKKVEEDNEHMKVNIPNEEYPSHIEKLISNSKYTRDITYDEYSNILILQTCSYEKSNLKSYYIISAIEIE